MSAVVWHIDGQPDDETFATEGEAVARAWALTPAGGTRPAVHEIAVVGTGGGQASMKVGNEWVPIGYADLGPNTSWLRIDRPKGVAPSEAGGVVVEVTAYAQKEHTPESLLNNEGVLAEIVWSKMEQKIRDSFGPDTATATITPESAGWVSHRMRDVGPTGAATFMRRFRVIYK